MGRLYSVSCPTASFCAAVDTIGHALTYDGSTWSSPDEIDNGRSPSSVSCPTPSFCATLDYSGHVLTYHGSSWSTPDSIDAGERPELRFVPDGELLRRGGRERQRPHLRRHEVVEAGQNRSERGRPAFRFVPDGELLHRLVDSTGNILTYHGSSWSSAADETGSNLSSVSCPTASFCAAVDLTDVFIYSPPSISKTALEPSAAKVTYGDEQVEHLSVTVSPQYSDSTPTGTVTVTGAVHDDAVHLHSVVGQGLVHVVGHRAPWAPIASSPPTAAAPTSTARLLFEQSFASPRRPRRPPSSSGPSR